MALLSLGLAGCLSVPKQMVAQFDAPNGELIVIKKDGAVYWSPPSKTSDRLSFVGIAAPKKAEPLVVPLVVYSASPYLYVKITFSPDYSRLTMDWGQVMDRRRSSRATDFMRKSR